MIPIPGADAGYRGCVRDRWRQAGDVALEFAVTREGGRLRGCLVAALGGFLGESCLAKEVSVQKDSYQQIHILNKVFELQNRVAWPRVKFYLFIYLF